jgi:hypothetical protein
MKSPRPHQCNCDPQYGHTTARECYEAQRNSCSCHCNQTRMGCPTHDPRPMLQDTAGPLDQGLPN